MHVNRSDSAVADSGVEVEEDACLHGVDPEAKQEPSKILEGC